MPRGATVDPDRLRMLAKKASALHLGGGVSMNEAVVSAVREEHDLGSEHVRRVVEFSNNETFHQMFEKAGSDHRVFAYDGGPADPAFVLKELNMGAVPSPMAVSDRTKDVDAYVPGADSAGDPFATQKTASEYPSANPQGSLIDARTRLQGMKDHFTSEISAIGVVYDDAVDSLCKEAKQAILRGWSPAHVARAMQHYAPDPNFTKLAMQHINRLVEQGSLPIQAATGTELVKEGTVPNPKHPIVGAFNSFVKAASERFRILEALDLVDAQLGRIESELKGAYR